MQCGKSSGKASTTLCEVITGTTRGQRQSLLMITPLLSPASHLVIDTPDLSHSGHVRNNADESVRASDLPIHPH